MSDDVDGLLAGRDAAVVEVAERLRALVRQAVPDAVEEPDASSGIIGYTFRPGSYSGLIVAIAPHAAHVNLMVARGVELLEAGVDGAGLLEGSGRKARHVKLRSTDDVGRAEVRALIEEAARRTPGRP